MQPGQRVSVELEVENQAPTQTSFLLVEDRLPSQLGRSARLVVAALPGKGRQRVRYSITPHRRGRFALGPLTVDLSDPFALTRLRVEFDEREDLVVTPEVEDLTGGARLAVRRDEWARPRQASVPDRATSSTRCVRTSKATTCAGSTGRASPAATS